MTNTENTLRAMPDVATDARPHTAGTLDWVGMDEIDVPVRLAGPDGDVVQVAARATAYVNLTDPQARGIHMSRMYLHLGNHLSAEVLTPSSLRRLLRDFLDSHADLSDRAMLRLRFDHLLRRRALVSDNSGWRAYPVTITASLERDHFTLELACEVAYSSTCPASAALARQLIQQRFTKDFGAATTLDRDAILAWLGSEQGIVATPHSQRSAVLVRARLAPCFDLPIVDVINAIETALKTTVQTAVKREDEQAFALLNGQNLMFCEDAARRIHRALDADERISDFWLRATHYESLHPHNAVAVVSKGVEGGYGAGEGAFAI